MEQESTEHVDKTSPGEIREFFVDYHKRKQMALGELDANSTDFNDIATEEPGDEGDVTGDFEEDKKLELPIHVKYVKEVGVFYCKMCVCVENSCLV